METISTFDKSMVITFIILVALSGAAEIKHYLKYVRGNKNVNKKD